MLYVRFGGITRKTVWDIDGLFDNIYEDDWFRDDLVVEMVKDIDKSDLIDLCVISPFLGQIPVTRLSGGVKALIFWLKCSDEELEKYPLDLMVCGENCQKWIIKVAERRDITVSCSTYDLVFKDLPIRAVCLNDNSRINSWQEWRDKLCSFHESPDFDAWVHEDLHSGGRQVTVIGD